jgi:hypothetical protein
MFYLGLIMSPLVKINFCNGFSTFSSWSLAKIYPECKIAIEFSWFSSETNWLLGTLTKEMVF